MYLSGGTPLVDLVECLGVEGTLGVVPLTAGWGASLEMIGLVDFPTVLSLSTVAGVVTLVIGVTGNNECPFKLVEGVKRKRVGFSFKVPWLCFSLKLEMRR